MVSQTFLVFVNVVEMMATELYRNVRVSSWNFYIVLPRPLLSCGARGSALTGLVCAICSVQGDVFLGIPSKLFLLGYVASLSTKLADTFASEIGKAYGKTTFLITTFERVNPGTEGAVSLEGTLASVVGGAVLALYGWGVGLVSLKGVGIATMAAFIATNVESLLGATIQGKKGLEFMTNEVVNFLNTLIGASIAMAGGMLLL
mmetsp:Transcript_1800/g.4340  ORF Transcript_1800/g.4340 Transcript_1800/m.4340 type:complete len:203 (-) Transcript_1800:28-636(-)